MTPEQKQTELERQRTILLATLDYLEQYLGGSIVYDQYDPVTEYYQQQKIQIEKYFKQRRLDRLQQRFASLTKGLQYRDALAFSNYIKEKTGYNIDNLKDVQIPYALVIEQNEIRNQKELNEVGSMLQFFQENSPEGEEAKKLKKLISNYSQRQVSYSNKTELSKFFSRIEKVEGTVEETVEVSTGTKPKYYEEQVVRSPDGKRSLRIAQWSDGKNASTYVAVEFPTSSGAVFGLNGIYPDVTAWWKDNSTIIIKTKKDYPSTTKHKQVRSFDDQITIEYMEH